MTTQNSVFAVKNGMPTRAGVVFLVTSLFEAMKNKRDIEIMSELITEPEKKEPLPEVWPYRKSSRCVKCGFSHLMSDTPVLGYIKELNVVDRRCGRCHFGWFEKCEDESEPIVPYKWMGPEERTIKENPFEIFLEKLESKFQSPITVVIRKEVDMPRRITNVAFQWVRNDQTYFISKLIEHNELNMILESADSLEGFLNIFYPELVRKMEEIENDG